MEIQPVTTAAVARVRLEARLVLVSSEPASGLGANRLNEATLVGSPANVGGLWDDLVAGRLTFVRQELDADCVRLVMRFGPPHRTVRHGKNIEALKSALTGNPQKVLALEQSRSGSTISSHVSAALESLGVPGSLRRAPLGLAMLAATHDRGTGFSALGFRLVAATLTGELVLSMPWPDEAFRSWLTPIELEVLRAIVAGKSQRQVGDQRQRSARTVANQISSIATKLGVRGRFGFIGLAVALMADRPPKPRIVADGRESWAGWAEVKTEPGGRRHHQYGAGDSR